MLGDDVRPVQYAVDLTLVPRATTFKGIVDIDLSITKPTSLVWLNALEITIHKATIAASGKTQIATVETGDKNFIALRVPADVPAGPARMHIEYEGKISDNDTAGVFRGLDGNESYLFTQFEPTEARRAVPCFDQPGFKTPWQVTLHVRRGDTAVSNTAQIAQSDEAGDMKRVVFAPTKPLPSYLVAVAVGPFDIVDGGKTGRNHIPVRIITPKGKANQARYAAEVTGTIIQRLEDYFGLPFPFDKADQVAVPLTVGFGAMENAGMVTYEQNILLSDPATDTITRQRRYAQVAAHELAHQWFGDMVTTAWWDDIWLNEAFATWTSSKIIAQWKPEWNGRLADLDNKFGAMETDSLVSSRQIRQPIESQDDIVNAFDGITYQKGAAVIRMFENWVGEQRFQQGVTAYLKRYSNRNARAGDFLDAIAGAGAPQLPRAFSSFLEQPGLPEISVELKCDKSPRVVLTQKRYLPIGSDGAQNQKWQTPVCIRYQGPGGPQRECFLLDRNSAEFSLSKATTCPSYLSANDSGTGYYVSSYQGDLLPKLLAEGNAFLNQAERMTLLHDIEKLAEAGDSRESQALEAVQAFADSPEPRLNGGARRIVADSRRLLPLALLPNYASFVHRLFGARAVAMGWAAKPGEDQETRLLRRGLVQFVARDGNDLPLQAEARRLTDGWLKNRQGVDPDMLTAVLNTAVFAGGQDLFDALWAELKKTQDRQQRRAILTALSQFRDPGIAQQFLQLLLDPQMDMKESFGQLMGPLTNRETEKLPFEFLKSNYDAILKRLPSEGFDARADLPLMGQFFCDEDSRQEFVSFFQDKVKDWTGGQRTYAQVLEGIRLCEARKAAQGPDVAAFFANQ